MDTGTRDLASRSDVVRLVDGFYGRVRADAMLGPIFSDVAQIDWDDHLPKMYDFWEMVLFGKAGFKGDPAAVHRALGRRTPLSAADFDRWILLFHATVDDLFDGPVAAETKQRASRIAAVLQHHVASDPDAVPSRP